jgi:hypothetical protein
MVAENLIKNFSYEDDETIYKLIKSEMSKTPADMLFTIQLIGKDIFFKLSPNDIIKDEKILYGFSKREIRVITAFAFIQQGNQYFTGISLESIKFIGEKQKAVFSILGKNEKIERDILEIDMDFIQKLDPKAAFQLGIFSNQHRH